ncbi:cellulase family glycosylhydrolase [Bacillus sp. NPDC077027]|uniref:cellulase family glycosylhydrolase n=1 Tax=Bacillus sp. NPDC077027 TaxID=3390548 RepID=UPI003D04A6D8
MFVFKKLSHQSLRLLVVLLLLGTASPFLTSSSAKASKESQQNVNNTRTPQQVVDQMAPGWNLGNTLDAVPTEGSWNNPPVSERTFDDIKAAGFKSVRIPVTWDAHIGSAPNYTIDEKWMKRVEQVTDWALQRDFYVVLNVHHDSWLWINQAGAKQAETFQKLEKVWRQIAERFGNRSHRLIFEIVNEPDGMSAYQLNLLNQQMLQTIRSTGGQNKERLTIIGGLQDNAQELVSNVQLPDDPNLILTFHFYSPWNFVSNWWGSTTWGSEQDVREMRNEIKPVYDRFVSKGYPVIIGEYGTLADTDQYSKRFYHHTLIQVAGEYQMATMWWDNGNDQFDREARRWRDEVVKDIIVQGSLGKKNALIDPGELWIKTGREHQDQTMKMKRNGNTLSHLVLGSAQLNRGVDYTVDGDTVTLKRSLIERIVTNSSFGVKDTLHFIFSEGANQQLKVILYDEPKPDHKEVTISKSAISGDLNIPVQFNGTRLATVKGVTDATSRPVLEDEWSWTPYMNAEDDFTSNRTHVILKEKVLKVLKSDATFTFEFFPKGTQFEVKVKVTP